MDGTIPDLLKTRAREHGQRPAVSFGGETMTWSELADRVHATALGLSSLGVRSGCAVAIALPNCPEFIVSFLAVAAAGGVVVPLSTHFREYEVTRYLEDFEVETIVTDDALYPMYRRLMPGEDRPVVVVERSASPHQGVAFPTLEDRGRGQAQLDAPSPQDRLMFQLSSGTTGKSKRIARSHFNLVREAANLTHTVSMQPDDRVLCVVPLFHTYGLGNCLLGPLQSGATTVIAEKFQRRGTLQLLPDHGITIFPAVPFMLGILADTKPVGGIDLSALRLCMSAGAPLARETFDRFQARYGVPIRQQYGTTETGVISVNLESDIESWAESVGRAVNGVAIRIVGDDGGDLHREGEGEVSVKSEAMTDGYFENETLTQERFRDGYFRTGDLSRIDAAGRLTIIGRKKIFINTATHKVDPSEVEGLIAGHPKVEAVVVVGVPGPYADEQIKAVIVAREECSEEEILGFCRDKIADYKIPRIVDFQSEIPRNPMGKILRKYLQEPG